MPKVNWLEKKKIQTVDIRDKDKTCLICAEDKDGLPSVFFEFKDELGPSELFSIIGKLWIVVEGDMYIDNGKPVLVDDDLESPIEIYMKRDSTVHITFPSNKGDGGFYMHTSVELSLGLFKTIDLAIRSINRMLCNNAGKTENSGKDFVYQHVIPDSFEMHQQG